MGLLGDFETVAAEDTGGEGVDLVFPPANAAQLFTPLDDACCKLLMFEAFDCLLLLCWLEALLVFFVLLLVDMIAFFIISRFVLVFFLNALSVAVNEGTQKCPPLNL